MSVLEAKAKSLEERAMHVEKEVVEAKNLQNKLDFAYMELRVKTLEKTLEDERREGERPQEELRKLSILAEKKEIMRLLAKYSSTAEAIKLHTRRVESIRQKRMRLNLV